MTKAMAAKARLGYSTNCLCASVSTMVVSEVEWLMAEAVKNTISSAGSARKETSISRRAPSVPKEVPMSIAASAMKTRARAKMPTSAITSTAGGKRQIDRDHRHQRGGQPHADEQDVGGVAEQGRGVVGQHRVLVEQLDQVAVGLQDAGAAAVLHPGAAVVDPAQQQRRGQHHQHVLEQLQQEGRGIHRTNASNAMQGHEAVQQVKRNAAMLQLADQRGKPFSARRAIGR